MAIRLSYIPIIYQNTRIYEIVMSGQTNKSTFNILVTQFTKTTRKHSMNNEFNML